MCSRLFFLGAMCALFTAATSAQNTIPGNTRTGPAPAPVPAVVASEAATAGVAVTADSKLVPGDFVSIQIEEDREDPWKTVVTDAGEVEISNLGSVRVLDRTASDAEAVIGAYLRQKYYHRATVRVKIIQKVRGAIQASKVNVAGKVQRAGPQFFNEKNVPLKVSEAVIVAGTTAFSDLRKVQLTRGGRNIIVDVDAIIKNGRTDLDMPLSNGDQIFVRERSWVPVGSP